MQTSLTPERIEELKNMSMRIRIEENAYAESVDGKPSINVIHDALVEVLASLSHP